MNSNQLQHNTKWYDKTWLAILLVFVFFPIGFYALYKSKQRSTLTKVIVTIIFLIMVFITTKDNPKETSNDNETIASITKSDYQRKVEQAIKNLPPEKKAKRDSILKELIKNQTYIDLVKNKNVSQNYFSVLMGIGNTLASYTSENFGMQENIAKKLEHERRLDFVVNLGTLISKGGLPMEIEDVFNRYVNTYGITGNKGALIINANTGNQEEIKDSYSFSQAMAIFTPKDKKVLDSYFEAIQDNIFAWDTNPSNEFLYPYMNNPDEFNEHLRKYYPKSKYFLDYDVKTTPVLLNMEYQQNEVAADQKYLNRTLLLNGTVIEIGKDAYNDAYIILNTGSEFNRVQCFSFNQDIIAKLSRGSQVRVIGKCFGKNLLNVVLKNCEIQLKDN